MFHQNGKRANPEVQPRTTAVDMYPAGAAGCGALDMSGNVEEWCLNEYDNINDITLSSNNTRALRGGSWYYLQYGARAGFRLGSVPPLRDFNFGFRASVSVHVFLSLLWLPL